MSTKIFEEKPAAAPAAGMGDAKAKIEKQARQLAYDTRYQVKKEIGDKKVDPKTMGRLLLQRLQKSSAIPAVKMRAKQMLLGEEYIESSKELAVECVANAMFKVFVEGNDTEPSTIELNYLKELAENPDKKYKVRVTDKKTGNSYVRYATRDKITQLRANPNIQSVEMTEYGEPREGERTRGETTAKAKSGKDWDGDGKKESPAKEYRGVVHNAIQRRSGGKADGQDTSGVKEGKDWDGDGKKESGAKEYRGVVHNAIQRRSGGKADGQDTSSVKEDFLADAAVDSSNKKITGKGVDNYAGGKDSVVKVFPNDTSDKVDRFGQSGSLGSMGIMAGYDMEGDVLSEMSKSKSQQRFMGMVYAAKKGEKPASPEVAKAAAGMSKKEAKKFAKTKHKGLPGHVEEAASCDDGNEDKRNQYAKKELIKNKIRAALGVKNPIVMTAGYELDGKTISEREFDEPGEPRGTQRMKVDPAAWKKSMDQWKKLQPEIFDRKPGSGQVKGV